MKLLFLGDIVGEPGCAILRKKLPAIKKSNSIDICIANGENSAKGNGITPQSAESLFVSGVDIITTGNHAFKRREAYDLLDSSLSIVRPENYSSECPGTGVVYLDMTSYTLCVINLSGSAYTEAVVSNPFDCIDDVLEDVDCKNIFVDFHAETTSEKRSMGFYLDGRVSAVIGTHTHVQTADEEILPGGTAYLTDAGMCGPINSVLGVKPELTIKKFRTGMPVKFENPDGECKIEGCIIEINEKTGKAVGIERVQIR